MKKKLILSAILSSSVVNLSPIAFSQIQSDLDRDLANDAKVETFSLVSKEKLKAKNGKEYYIRMTIRKDHFQSGAFNKLHFAMTGTAFAVFEENGKEKIEDLLENGEDGNVVFQLVDDTERRTEYFVFSSNSTMNGLDYPSSSIVYNKVTKEWSYEGREQLYIPLFLQ